MFLPDSPLNLGRHSLMRSHMFQSALLPTSNDQFMRGVIDVNIVQCDDNFIAKDLGHFFERYAFGFW